MLYLIALIYWLLCMRVSLRLEASLIDGKGRVSILAGALGVILRRDYVLVHGEHVFSLRLKPCRKRKQKKNMGAVSRLLVRTAKRTLLDPRVGERRLWLHLHLGLGDACDTAIAAGAVRALLCALASGICDLRCCDLRVTPVFDGLCLRAQMTGIFSACLGDIMLAALKAASGKRKEGFKWTSIPLRA